jgi:tyrosyl-tRNA synthetase
MQNLKHFIKLPKNDSLLKISKRNYLSEKLVHDLGSRGLIEDKITTKRTKPSLACSIYTGIDPTASSLHIGNLLPLLLLTHFQLNSYKPLLVLGTGTAALGDPSHRKSERKPLTPEQIDSNANCLQTQLHSLIPKLQHEAMKQSIKSNTNHPNIDMGNVEIVRNHEWYKDMSVLEFVSQIGRHFKVMEMINRHSMKTRLNAKNGLAFNELSYQLLQAYDFYLLFKNYNVKVQIGGFLFLSFFIFVL